MKNLLIKVTLTTVLFMLTSCSTESLEQDLTNDIVTQNNLTCVDSNPEARLTNNGTINFSFKIYDESYALIGEELNVAPGTSTSWSSFTEGDVVFSIKSSATGIMDMKKLVFMGNCTAFDVTIMSDNTLNSNSPVPQQ